MESRLEKIFSMGIDSSVVRRGQEMFCGCGRFNLLLGLSMVRRCSLNRSFKRPAGVNIREETHQCCYLLSCYFIIFFHLILIFSLRCQLYLRISGITKYAAKNHVPTVKFSLYLKKAGLASEI